MSLEDTKVLKDFTTEVDEKVPAAHKLAENVCYDKFISKWW